MSKNMSTSMRNTTNPNAGHRTLPASMRQRLFEPGKYLSLPECLLRRTDVSASAKLVWMALASHLGPRGTEVWPSINRLAAMTALARDTVLTAVAHLADGGLLSITKCDGRPNVYRILQPQAGLFEPPPKRSEFATGRNLPPVENPDNTGRKSRQPPVGNSDPKYCMEVLKEVERSKPPNPPHAGGVRGDACGRARNTRTETILQAVQRAWHEVFDQDLPSRLRRRIERGIANGDGSWLERIDAAAIRGGMALATAKGRTFGLGWIEKHLEQKALVRRQPATGEAHPEAQAQREAQGQRARQIAEALEAFRAMPARQRTAALKRAAQDNPRITNAAVLERLAAQAHREAKA